MWPCGAARSTTRTSAVAATGCGMSVELGEAQGPFADEAELCSRPVAFRWAMNLKRYDAEEPRRFIRYYEAMAPASGIVLARDAAAVNESSD